MADNAALDILRDQVDSLTRQLQSLTSERDEYRDALEEVSREREELREKLNDPGDVARENETLKQRIRDRTHYDRFAELAREAGAKDKAIKQLWKLSDHKAEDDEPDDRVLAKLIDNLKADADYAFEPVDAGTAARDDAARTSRGGLQIREDARQLWPGAG